MEMIDFGLIQEDSRKIWRLLRQDLKDDWLLDPLHFSDRKPDDFINYFSDNVTRNCGVFRPTKRELIDIPKGKGGLRYSLETSIYDRMAYHALGVTLIDHFDILISRRVFNHRLDINELNKKKRKYLFFNAIEQWKKFEEFVRIDAIDKTVLITDVQNYYENINILKLKDSLLDCLRNIHATGPVKARLRFCIDSITECLISWSFNGNNGLPQNRDISSFLANIYMLPVDHFLIKHGIDFYRYMDDIRILCDNRYIGRSVLKELIGQLRILGLNINISKTFIHEPKTDEHNEFIKKDSYQLEMIDSMLNTKKKPIVAKAITEVKRNIECLIDKGDLCSRNFRFFNARVCRFALCKDIAKPPDFYDSITSGMIRGLYDSPEVSDQLYYYLSSVPLENSQLKDIENFLTNKTVAIYGWQNYLLWKLLILKEHQSEGLLKEAESLLSTSSNIPNKSGAVLYLGAFAGQNGKIKVAQQFKSFDSFLLQRHALIALQRSSFDDIKESITDHILPESLGILKALSCMDVHCFVKEPEPIRYSDLIREVSFYV